MFLINGRFSDSVSVQDRGLQYGDGIFETIAMWKGKSLCWEAHYRRLEEGCKRLGMHCPTEDLLSSEIHQLPVTGPRSVVKIIVTRGPGGRGYQPPDPTPTPTRILGLFPWPDFPPEHATAGIKARICSTRLGKNPQLAGIKHLNRLEQVLARGEWSSPDIAEGLMLDCDNAIIEGTMSNLFCVKDDVLITPDLSSCGIAGIIRGYILESATQLNIETSIQTFTRRELFSMDELFLCNSVIGIWPIREIEQGAFALGPRTLEIRALLIRKEIIAE
jgi:4-amino-4-deoxychorismate lyase